MNLCAINQKHLGDQKTSKGKIEIEEFELTLKLTLRNYIKLSRIYVDCKKCLEDTLEKVCDDYIENKLSSIEAIL